MVSNRIRNSSITSSTTATSSCTMSSVSIKRGGGGGVLGSTGSGSFKMISTTNKIHIGSNVNKTFEKPIRRKSILEKWLIWITLLVTSILLDCVYGDVMCYECAWQGSTPLPSTNDGVSDVCRPHNFNVNVVHKIKCANGCIKQALYEFENDPSSPPRGQQGAQGPNNNSATTNRTRTISLDNMTFYVRGCQKDKKTREACENKSFNDQVYAEECACLSDYCNGESSGGANSKIFSFFRTTGNHDNRLNLNENLFIPGGYPLLVNKNVLELSAISVLLNFGIFKLFESSFLSTSSLQ